MTISTQTHGTLSVVATPIGNMEDISLRALRVLREADVIFCEDTRVTRNLCKKYEIDVPLRRLDAHTELHKAEEVVSILEAGKKIVLVSDAGTPGISDPGSRIVDYVRTTLAHRVSHGKNDSTTDSAKDITIDAIPGPSALTALISISGLACARFVFSGFSPHKKGRETFFREALARDMPTIFYESPHRLTDALERLAAGDSGCLVCVGRELTKVYEEVQRGPVTDVLAWYRAHPPKGECVVIVSPRAS